MPNKLKYINYCNYYSSKCNICNGNKYVISKGTRNTCKCQYIATIKYRFDKIDIKPPELKKLSWSDFTGEIMEKSPDSGKIEVVGFNDIDKVVKAKEKAMNYCFGDADFSLLNDRRKNSIIPLRYKTSSNLIIYGPHKSGKSLLATIIIKEIVYSSVYHNLSFEWIKMMELIHAARWDNNKLIDYGNIDKWEDVSFLIIDEVEMLRGGHNTPPDIIILNNFFSNRHYNQPTILILSKGLMGDCRDKFRSQIVKDKFGSEFYSLVMDTDNTFIEL